jgi:hypothetical protein
MGRDMGDPGVFPDRYLATPDVGHGQGASELHVPISIDGDR